MLVASIAVGFAGVMVALLGVIHVLRDIRDALRDALHPVFSVPTISDRAVGMKQRS